MKRRTKRLRPSFELDFLTAAFGDLNTLKETISDYFGRPIEWRELSPTFYRLPAGLFDELAIVQKPNSPRVFLEAPGAACAYKQAYSFIRDILIRYDKKRPDDAEVWRIDVKFDAVDFQVEDIIPPKFHTTDIFASRDWELQRFSANGSSGRTTSLRFVNQNCKIRTYQKDIQLQKLADKKKATVEQLQWLAKNRGHDVVRFELELRSHWCRHGDGLIRITDDEKRFANEVASYFIRNCPAKVDAEE